MKTKTNKLGIVIIGISRAVASTAVAGIELLKQKKSGARVCRSPLCRRI
jgi:hypothetical protein